MSVEEIKRGLEELTDKHQDEVTAFLFYLRHLHDTEYHEPIARRLADRTPGNWISLDEFERRINAED